MNHSNRFALVMIILGLCSLGLRTSTSQAEDEAENGLRLVAFGVLEQAEDTSGDLVLRNHDGRVTYHVAPASHTDAADLVGRRVQVVGKLKNGDSADRRTIVADQLKPTEKESPDHFVEERQEAEANTTPASNTISDQQQPEAETAQLFRRRASTAPVLLEDQLMMTDESAVLLDDPLVDNGAVIEDGDLFIDDMGYCDPPVAGISCGNPELIWITGETLIWRTKSLSLPTLVTTSPLGTTPQDAVTLGSAGQTVLIGNTHVLDDGRLGGRLTIGGWLGPRKRLGLEGEYLRLDETRMRFRAESNGVDIIARPYTNTNGVNNPPGPDRGLISYPAVAPATTSLAAGSVGVTNWGKFSSFGLRLRGNIACQCGNLYTGYDMPEPTNGPRYRVDLIGGYRSLRLDEQVELQTSQVHPSNIPTTGWEVLDRFRTDNDFNGGEIGFYGEYIRGRLSTDGVLKVAVGRTRQHMTIYGQSIPSSGGVELAAVDGGLLALSGANMGDFERKKTDMVIEFGCDVGYMLTRRLRATFGYSLIYWPHTLRPGEAIDLNVNGSYIPGGTPIGAAAPTFVFNDSHYWAQGINLGLDYRW